MCVIAVAERQLTDDEITRMFVRNPHGAGYMFARGGKVHIRKGFMTPAELIESVRSEGITSERVVYHFRFSTQAGVKRSMCHPFPLSRTLKHQELLNVGCQIGVAHNGVIPCTSDPQENRYSDTALFVSQVMSWIIRKPEQIHDRSKLDKITEIAGKYNKFAIMDGSGSVELIGDFTEVDGILVSNTYWRW